MFIRNVSRSLLVKVVLCVVLSVVALPGFGQAVPTTQEEVDQLNRYVEKIDYSVAGKGKFTEQVDPFSRNLSIGHEDLMLPGNGGLDLAITRHYVTPQRYFSRNLFTNIAEVNQGQYPMGFGWDIHFGYIAQLEWGTSTKFHNWQNSLIDPQGGEEFTACYIPEDSPTFYETLSLVSSSGGTEAMLPSLSHTHMVTESGWRGGCAGNGFVMYSPEGIKYTYDQVKYGAASHGVQNTAYSYGWYVSRIEDKHGNWINIHYTSSDQAIFDYISTSDGRRIDFEYSNIAGVPTLVKITSGGQSIQYVYDAQRNLSAVKVGARTLWQYTYAPFYEFYDSSTIYLLTTLTTESGGVISYEYCYCGLVYTDTTESNALAVSKRITSGSLPANTETYLYRDNETYPLNKYGQSSEDVFVTGDRRNHIKVLVQDDQRCTKTIFNEIDQGHWLKGKMAFKQIYNDPSCTDLLRTEEYHWDKLKLSAQRSQRKFYGYYVGYVGEVLDRAHWKAVLKEKIVTENGDTYTTLYSDFFSFGKPQKTVETGPNGARTITATYVDGDYQYGIEHVTEYSVLDADGGVVSKLTREYDALFRLTKNTRNGLATSYTYDAEGNIASVTDGEGNTQTFTDYYRGTARTTSDSIGSTQQTLDNVGNVTSRTDELGHTTRYEYSDFTRLKAIIPPLGARVDYSYIADTQVVTHGRYKKTTKLDGFGRSVLMTEQDTVSGRTRYQNTRYNPYGQQVFASILSESPTESSGSYYEYDAIDRLTETVTPLGTTQYAYLTNETVEHTDALGRVSRHKVKGYGAPDYGNTVQSEHASSSGTITTQINKDESGRIHQVTQGGYSAHYTYHNDYLDLVVSEAYPQFTFHYEYDAAGNTISRKTAKSDKTVYAYDSRNRLAAINYPSGTPDVAYTYSDNNRLLSATNGIGDWSFAYNANGNVTSRTLVTGTKTYAFTYSYDAQNNLSAMAYPGSINVDYAPNAFGEATKAGAYAADVRHYAQTGLKSFNYGNGISYDLALAANKVLIGGIVGKRSGTTIINKSYSYDGEINVTNITDHIRPQYSVNQFEYDELNRLRIAYSPSWGGAIEYTYDKTGNITSQHLPGETKNYSYNTINQLTQVSGFTPLTFSYDIYGNVADNGRHHFIYNDAGQLISADDGQYDKVYLYDAMGKRVQVIDHDGNTEYEVYDESDRLLLVEESDGSLKRKIYLGNKLIAHNRSGEVKYIHFDTLGSTIAVSDADGILDLEHYRPYGEKVEWPLGTDNEQWYTGKRFDWDISLSYHGARYYDPAIGRFYANDPVGFLGHVNRGNNPAHGFNRYAYANNNPYKYTDPDGKFINFAVKFVADVALGVAIQAATGQKINIGAAVTDSVKGALNPAKTIANAAKLAKAVSKLSPGKFANKSIPARGASRSFTKQERSQINEAGKTGGCHTCGTKNPGTKSGNFIPDHQPPNALNKGGGSQRLFPHCKECSQSQAGQVTQAKRSAEVQPPACQSGHC